jgi:hypothetical protein
MSPPNKIVSKTFFCMECKTGPFSVDEILQHGCLPPFKVLESIITCTKKPLRRFIDWLLQDITYGLAFMGGVIINAILIPHFHLSLGQSLLESFCLGFLLIRLLKG